MFYIIAWKIAGAFLGPNGMRTNFHVPFLVTNAKYPCDAASTGTYQ
jgi:hypothetical protein